MAANWKKVLAAANSADITVPDDTGTIALTGTATPQRFLDVEQKLCTIYGDVPNLVEAGSFVEDTGTLTNGVYVNVTTTKIDGTGSGLTALIVVSDVNGSGTFGSILILYETGQLYHQGDRIKITGLLAAGCTGANDDGEFTIGTVNKVQLSIPWGFSNSGSAQIEIPTLPMVGTLLVTPNSGTDIDNATGNISLNGQSITNDGVDGQGLTMANDGGVTVASDTVTGDILKLESDTVIDGNALLIELGDTSTSSNQKSMCNLDYNKTGITHGSGPGPTVNITEGFRIRMHDAATNTGVALVKMTGVDIETTVTNSVLTVQTGMNIVVDKDSDGVPADCMGIGLKVSNGGPDIKMSSSTSLSDYFSIRVDDNGEGFLKTYDGGSGVLAHLNLDADGDIILDSASGNIYVKDDGGNYTPGSDYEIATKKYVDDNGGSGEANEFSFKTIAISGETDVVADTTTDTLTLVAGTDITMATTADQITINSTASGSGEDNEFSFKTISVAGQSDVVADTTTDTLTLVAGTDVTMTTTADEITINSTASGGGITTGKSIAMAMIFG